MLLRHGGLLRPVCRHYAIQGLVIHDFFIFGQCVCGSSDEGIVVALADDYSAPFSRRSAEGLGEDTHEDYRHVARSYRTFNYNAPVSGAEWAQSPYEYENTTGPAEGPDELDPDLEVEEESWKLHQQAVEYQKHQEEELKHYSEYVEKQDCQANVGEVAASSHKAESHRNDTVPVSVHKRHMDKDDMEFESEKSGWFNHCTVFIALCQMNRLANARCHADLS